jgi:cytoskeletal protein CcmA (bactofilin family)
MDSYFGKGIKLTGTLWAKGDVHFDADIVGEVFSENHFFVGQSGFVDGDLHVYDFSNSGEVKGNIYSENKTRLMLGSNLKGNISTYQLVIDEGADFEGRCKMIDAPPVATVSKNKNLSKKPDLIKISTSISSSLDITENLKKKKLVFLKSFGFVLVGLLVVGVFLLRYPWSTGFENSLRDGYKLLKKNQYDAAEKEFNKALRANIDSPEVYAGLGETFYQNKRYKDSIAQFKKATELKPSNSDYKIKLAMAYDMSEKLTDAETFYRLAIDANSDNANAYHHYGIFMQARGDLNDAVKNFRKATKLKKDFYQAHHLLGNVFLKWVKKVRLLKSFCWL